MKFGVPFEIRQHEGRVGASPLIVEELVKRGHEVFVETRAGLDSGFSDQEYEKAGAIIIPSSEKLYDQVEFVLKIRNPMPVEYDLIGPQHTIFAFFNFGNNPEMAKALISRGCSCFAYEMVTEPDGTRPIMSVNGEIAGKMAVQQGMYFLETHNGGRGVLLSRVAGARAAQVTIIGAGSVGISAAQIAARLGANVVLMDRNYHKLLRAQSLLPNNVTTMISHKQNFEKILPHTDLLITAVRVIDLKATKIISRDLIKLLPQGAVIVDVDIDRGGSVETSKQTAHETPTFNVDGVIHYCVPNLAGVVPVPASQALCSAFLPLLTKIADLGFREAVKADPTIRSGLAIYQGKIVNQELAEILEAPFTDLNEETVEQASGEKDKS